MTEFTKFLAVSALLVCLLTGVVTMSFDKEIAFASQNADGVGVVSARGVWHRPDDTGTEKDVAGVCAFLDKLQRAGVNLVFLETFYHGMAMYRSTLVPYYTKFQSYNYGEYADYMSCFVAEADKRGIEVHAWVEDFYIGIEENYFTKNLPEWLLVTDKGSTRNTEGGGFIFLDPANAEVKNYLVSFYDVSDCCRAQPRLHSLSRIRPGRRHRLHTGGYYRILQAAQHRRLVYGDGVCRLCKEKRSVFGVGGLPRGAGYGFCPHGVPVRPHKASRQVAVYGNLPRAVPCVQHEEAGLRQVD